jgi:hypothetical protein
MDTLIVLGVLVIITLVGSIAIKTQMEKRRILRARLLVDLHDDLRRMQSALAVIPEVYLDIPTKLFMIKRLMQLVNQVQETGSPSESLTSLHSDLQEQLDKTLEAKDDSAARLAKWTRIDSADAAHEIRILIKYLHGQILSTVKTGLVPRAHGSRVVKNLKIMIHRIALDLNYTMARSYLKANKPRPALGKLRVALGVTLKSPIKQYLKTQHSELEKLIEQTEKKIINQRKQANKTTEDKLAKGLDKMQEEEDRDTKKNIYD